ncbi:MAG: MoaF N-terminal domain-containing protein [Oscillospiraceae bacterium]|nr:MoaF N-terminal domain-containing protein [Oscillospiraceae bacterium]
MWDPAKYPSELTLEMDDGRARSLAFLPGERVRWEGQEAACSLTSPGEGLFFLTFDLCPEPRVNLTLVLDMDAGLVTLVTCRQGLNPRRPTYIATEILTGAFRLPGKPLSEKRHGYTDELKGRAIRWDYDWGFSIVHVYVTERYYRIRLLQKMGDADSPYEQAMKNYVDRTEPAYYLRIRPGVVLFGFTEDNMDRVTPPEIACSSRAQLIDLNTVETVGRGFGQPGGALDVFRARGAFVDPLSGELDPGSRYYT